MIQPRKSLSDIIRGSRESIEKAWAETQAAGEMGPLPAGEYVARIISGELATSKRKETPSYKLTFRVIEGDYADRRFWYDLWLTPAALAGTKRDLAKIGVQTLDQLDKPLPQGIRCKVRLALRKSDEGDESNAVKTFEVIGIDPPEVDPFAPKADSEGGEK